MVCGTIGVDLIALLAIAVSVALDQQLAGIIIAAMVARGGALEEYAGAQKCWGAGPPRTGCADRLVLHAIVRAADIQDQDGGVLLMSALVGAFPFLLKLYADSGYQGPKFQEGLAAVCGQINVV